jgi:phosphohistidine phosphatase
MTHRLLLLRHDKSSWDDPGLADHDRPLAKRGRRAAERMGGHLRASGLLPDIVLCSSARRARETLLLLALGDREVRIEEDLYGAGERELLDRVRRLPDDQRTAMLVAHNPGMHDLAIRLAGLHPTAVTARLREKFPTGALAVFETDEGWAHLAEETVRLDSIVLPRELA